MSLTCFIQGRPLPPPQKDPAGCRLPPVWCGVSVYIGPTYFLLNFIAHANRTRMCNKAVNLLLCLLQLSTKYPLITAQCTSVHLRSLGIAFRLSVCPSVRLSVTLVIRDHIGWKSWKLDPQAAEF